jgi:phosphoenolpyruvate-protein phosphotransferase
MAARTLSGAAASPGVAVGAIRRIDATATVSLGDIPSNRREAELERAREALAGAAAGLAATAAKLREQDRAAEAEIVDTGVLMAGDPQLLESVTTAVIERGQPAEVALVQAADEQASAIAALDDPNLAARADDIRSIGRRAARLAAGHGANGAGPEPPDAVVIASDADAVIIASDLGPADVAELSGEICAVVLAGGAVSAHAAIVARALGVPMVVAVGDTALAAAPGSVAVVDGDAGLVVFEPSPPRIAAAREAMRARERARERGVAARALPSTTRDGHHTRVLANVASNVEVSASLEAGADGAGLIRTELPFLEASQWPTEAQHVAALEPILSGLRGRTATVRVLDFGGDKTPPFLRGRDQRGLRLLLEAPDALAAQLRAILRAGRECKLRVLLPMVSGPVEVLTARAALLEAVNAVSGSDWPQLGAMIETPQAAAAAHKLALRSDFLSIGTNDLTHTTLGSDRFSAAEAASHHPRVLALIDRSVRAAKAADVPIEVCGEAASDALMLPLLVGLGVDELSVGAARVGTAREWIRALRFEQAQELARRALTLAGAHEVAELVAPIARALELLERGDAAAQRHERGAGVVAVSSQA